MNEEENLTSTRLEPLVIPGLNLGMHSMDLLTAMQDYMGMNKFDEVMRKAIYAGIESGKISGIDRQKFDAGLVRSISHWRYNKLDPDVVELYWGRTNHQ